MKATRGFMKRLAPLLVLVLVVPWLAALAAALTAATGLSEQASIARADIVVRSISTDLDRALTIGVPIDHLVGLDEFLRDAVAVFPEVPLVMLTDTTGRVLFQLSAPSRPDLSVRFDRGDIDWTPYGLAIASVPLHKGTQVVGALLVGRSTAVRPANTDRLLVDFAVALSITLVLAVLVLRAVTHTMIAFPLSVATALDGRIGRREFDRLAPPIGHGQIAALLSSINRRVLSLNDDFARVRSYLTEVRDLSFNKRAAAEIAPLLVRLEALGRFSPDHLAEIEMSSAAPWFHFVAACSAFLLANVMGAGARFLPLPTVLGLACIGIVVAPLIVAWLGRASSLLAVLLHLVWIGIGMTVASHDPAMAQAAITAGALASCLSYQAMRALPASRAVPLTASTISGLVGGTGLLVLGNGWRHPEIVMIIAGVVGLVGLLVAIRLDHGSHPGDFRIRFRELVDVDRWWRRGVLQPRGWAVWLLTGLAVAATVQHLVGTPGALRGLLETFWMQAIAAWIGAILVSCVDATGIAMAYAVTVALAGFVLAAVPQAPPLWMAILAAALGGGHAALIGRPGSSAMTMAARASLAFAAGLLALPIGAMIARGLAADALIAGLGLLVAAAMVPGFLAAVWQWLRDRRRAGGLREVAP
ncbi:MAG: hypothetical protein P4M00_24455 [Azospirillaceae bacterium]|nr:hypothetical protein [Azospirillaceae bacterium]